MELLKTLLDEAKQPSIKKAAKRTYHRDYLKTKKKPYRKYDHQARAMEDEEESVEEGVFDFAKGAAQHIGGQIKQGVQGAVNAGKQASVLGDLAKNLAQFAQLLSAYDKLKGSQQPASAETQQNNQGTPDAFRMTQKPRMRQGQHGYEWQFSAYLQSLNGEDFLSEGIWDFMKGAGKHIGQQIAAPVQGAIAAGKQASTQADFTRAKTAASQKLLAILQQLKQMGPGAGQQLQQLASQNCGQMANRVLSVVVGNAKKKGIQL